MSEKIKVFVPDNHAFHNPPVEIYSGGPESYPEKPTRVEQILIGLLNSGACVVSDVRDSFRTPAYALA